MQALVFTDNQLHIDNNYPSPKPASGEALIRTLVAGVCSTDLEICKGYMNFHGVPGHEFVGVVEDINNPRNQSQSDLIGKRVVGSINCVCGHCDMCSGGLSNHCRNRTVLGIAERDGCFAQRFVLPAVNLIPVPDILENDQAVFTEPLAAACQARQQLHVEGTPYITVLGDGRLGLLVAQVMSQLNASVRVIGKHQDKINLCEKWGIKHRLLSDITLQNDQDVVVDCTGSAQGLEIAMRMVRPRGKIVLKTTVSGQAGIDLSPLVIHEVELIGSRCGSLHEALDMLTVGSVDVLSLISRRVRLEQSVEAVALASQSDVIKVLIDFPA